MKHVTMSVENVRVVVKTGILERTVLPLVANIITAGTVPMSVHRTARHVDTQTDFALVKQVGGA